MQPFRTNRGFRGPEREIGVGCNVCPEERDSRSEQQQLPAGRLLAEELRESFYLATEK
jgi:hypothetical protein